MVKRKRKKLEMPDDIVRSLLFGPDYAEYVVTGKPNARVQQWIDWAREQVRKDKQTEMG